MTAANDELFPPPLFELGDVVATPGALRLLEQSGIELVTRVQRHVLGDWSEMAVDDPFQNLLAVEDELRVLSSYRVGREEDSSRIWVITEADRSSNCVIPPEGY